MRLVAGWIGWVALSLAAGQVGNLLGNAAASPLYQRLDLPSWAPPGAVFAPVWITLYVVMGTAAWLVWRERGFDGARPALTLFVVHLLFTPRGRASSSGWKHRAWPSRKSWCSG
jgi:tryptophan-rich sensory protein